MNPNPSSLPPLASGTINIQHETIRCNDIEAIVGESGIKRHEGLIWKRNVVVAANGRRYVSKSSPSANPRNFELWLESCPQAVGVRPDGSIVLPRLGSVASMDALDVISNALTVVHRELGRQRFKTFARGIAFLLAGLALIAVFMGINFKQPKTASWIELMAVGTILLIAGFLLLGRTLSLNSRRRGIRKMLAKLRAADVLDERLLVEVVSPPSAASQAGFLPGFFTILAVILMAIPFMGPIISLVAVACTFRRKTWARPLAIMTLIVSIAVTTIGIIKM